MIINRIYETQNLLSLKLVSFLVGLRIYQHLFITSMPSTQEFFNYNIPETDIKIQYSECYNYRKIIHFISNFYLVQQSPVGHGLLMFEVSRTHTTTHHSR
jgi:hypothetical protein